MRLRKEPTPTGRFKLQLAGITLLFTLVIGAIICVTLHRNVIAETVNLTAKAVQSHFHAVFGDAFQQTPAAAAREAYQQMVRMHFDLYNISFARFFAPDGRVVFSYDQAETGRTASPAEQEAIRQLIGQRTALSDVDGTTLSVWIPVQDEKTGDLMGVVHLERDITTRLTAIRRILLASMLSLVAGSVTLYLLLRRNFDKSTEQIARQERQMRKMLAEVESTYHASLQALSSALDTRDHETNGHSFRVTAYALRLARELGVPEESLPAVMQGALLHDVGKIGVPDAILRKQGPLTPEEWQVMRQHVEIGYNMLRHISFLHDALEIVRHHHERWDGQGYPDRLKGEEIPLGARIFALCDAYDAITSNRPYRKGRSYEEAREEIIRNAGTQFDRDVVDAFLRIPREEWTRIGDMASAYREMNRPLDELFRASGGNTAPGALMGRVS